jgi:hypothetical protein
MDLLRSCVAVGLPFAPPQLPTDALPSWNDTAAMATILTFVEGVMEPASDNYVTPSDRVAVFDDVGTFRCKD